MRRIKAVLFDKDGTLLDFNRTWGPAVHAVITRLSDGNADHLAALIKAVGFTPHTTSLSSGSMVVSDPTPTFGAVWAAILQRAATQDFFSEIDRLCAEEVLQTITPFPPARLALEGLAAQGLQLGLATNDAEANARAQLRQLGWDALFPFVAGYDSGHGPKPEPGMVLAFARHVGAAPHEVAMVGDSLHDLSAARAAGALAIAVLTGLDGDAARDLLTPHADVVIASLEHLESALM